MAGGKGQAHQTVVIRVIRLIAPAHIRLDSTQRYMGFRLNDPVGTIEHMAQGPATKRCCAIALTLVRGRQNTASPDRAGHGDRTRGQSGLEPPMGGIGLRNGNGNLDHNEKAILSESRYSDARTIQAVAGLIFLKRLTHFIGQIIR